MHPTLRQALRYAHPRRALSAARNAQPRNRALAGLAAVAVAAGVTWPQIDPTVLPEAAAVALVPPDPPMGAVEIVDVAGGVVWTDSHPAEVVVTVHNARRSPVTAEVWWLLAPVGSAQPWVDPVGQGEPQKVRLAARETRDITVTEMRPPRPGTWSLSVWAHVLRGSKRAHSHGANATPVVRVLSTQPDVVHFGQPTGRAVINLVRPAGRLLGTGSGSGDEPDALVSLQAATQQPVEVEVVCYLTPQPHPEPWVLPEVLASGPTPLTLDGAISKVAACTFPTLPSAGQWTLSAFAWRQAGFIPEPPEDGVHLSTPVPLDPVPVPTEPGVLPSTAPASSAATPLSTGPTSGAPTASPPDSAGARGTSAGRTAAATSASARVGTAAAARSTTR